MFPLQERLFDLQRKRGYVYHKVIYVRYKKPARLKRKGAGQAQMNDDDDKDDGNQSGDDNLNELEYLLFFKTCIVDRDLEVLKIRLRQTIEMREILIKKKGTQFHKTFPFYFIEPSLVSTLSN